MNFEYDPLWVPVISHYSADGALDTGRCLAQLDHISPDVWQYLIAGTTGDGWEMSDAVLEAWLDLCTMAMRPNQAFLVGAFGADATAVISRARKIEDHFRARPSAAKFAGLTVCAQVDGEASQAAITDHFRAILEATSTPLAVYQLPQVTGCSISPETFASLARDSRVRLFKDTSGTDEIADAGVAGEGTFLVRGAERRYAHHLKPLGRYDGWLLSTANYLASELRQIVQAVQSGEIDAAVKQSDALDVLVDTVFAGAQSLGRNAFADASRAGDHIRAYGSDWAAAPPACRADGSALPADFLELVEDALREFGADVSKAYLSDVKS